MARGDIENYRIDWDRFCQIVIERWQGKLREKDIYDTGTLYNSIEYGYRGANAINSTAGRGSVTVPDTLAFSFPMYGIYVERGVGRGYAKGNGGNLVKFQGKGRGRERRWWYYNVFAQERKRLGELVCEAYGRAAMQQILTIEVKSISRKNT